MYSVFGLGLEHSCPWSRECLSSRSRSLASDFFCVHGLEPCVLDSTSTIMPAVGIYAIAASLCVCKLKRKIFAEECNKCCFAGFAFDVDFDCFELQLQFQFYRKHKTNYTFFF